MRIATWNVNSLRARIDRVEKLLSRHGIDVLALQETKAREDQLPLMGFQAAGYDVAVAGQDQWNGVALVSRVGLEDVHVGFAGMPTWGEPATAESRAIGAMCGGVRVWSVYVPNGRKPDDPHYEYKLAWLEQLRIGAREWIDDPTIMLGDWNIAPTDADVFDVLQFAKSTHVTPRERAAFGGFLEDGWTEVTRQHAPGFTYWDYYRQRFERDRGLKIDFALASPSVASRVSGAMIDRDERDPAGGEGTPSDHAPLVIDLAD